MNRGGDAPSDRVSCTYLIVAPWRLDAIGGVSTAIHGIMKAFDRGGTVRPLLLTNDWAALRLRAGMSADQHGWFLRVPDPLLSGSAVSRLVALLVFFPYALLQLHAFLKRERVDVVNVHYPGLSCIAFVALRALGAYSGKLVLSFHGQDMTGVAQERMWLRRSLWQLAIARSDAIVACSQRLASEIATLLQVDRARLHVVDNGVEVLDIQNVARDSQAPEVQRPFVLCLTTFERKKGLDTLVESFRELAARYPELHLVIAGRRAGQHADLERQVASAGLSERIYMIPDLPHERAMALLKDAELLVLPSRKEPFGLVLLEAAALGIPVVFTAVCGAADVLPARLVTVVPAENPAALAEAIGQVLEDMEDARARARELRGFVQDHLSWDTAARKYAKIACGIGS